MVFSTPSFIFVFLPLVFLIHLILPAKWKNFFLVFSSLVFYFLGEKNLIPFIIAMMLTFLLARGLDSVSRGRKVILFLGLLINLGILVYYKYFNFLVENLEWILVKRTESLDVKLLLGVSFFVFQLVSYLIDVYHKRHIAEKNVINFLLYISFFPQLIAGPIVRYSDIKEDLHLRNIFSDDITQGFKRFIVGLGKKVILANYFGNVADTIMTQNLYDLSTLLAWLGIISYSFQIYFDFSGYSDMAIGMAKLFGFKFNENFNYPYVAGSVKEFWRRWHISLSTWFRDYVYLPLGGSRVGRARVLINLFIVFCITGFWHGASWSFALWGIFHGSFIVLEKTRFGVVLEKAWKPVQHVYLLLVVITGWVFFRIENIYDALTYLKAMFNLNSIEANDFHMVSSFINREFCFYIFVAIVSSVPTIPRMLEKIRSLKWHSILLEKWIANSLALSLLIICYLFIAASTYNPFIYFRF